MERNIETGTIPKHPTTITETKFFNYTKCITVTLNITDIKEHGYHRLKRNNCDKHVKCDETVAVILTIE